MPDSNGNPYLSEVLGRGVHIDGDGFSIAAGGGWTTLTDASTIAVNTSSNTKFKLTLTASGHTIANPTGGEDGDILSFRINVGAGPYTNLWGNKYAFTFGSAPPQSIVADEVDTYDFRYNEADDAWEALVPATDQLRAFADALGSDDDLPDAFWKSYRFVPVPKGSIRHDDDIHPAKFASSTEVFDGTDDNTTAILLARDALLTRGNGRLLLPPRCRLRQNMEILGVYGPVFTGLGSSVQVCGDDANGTIIYFDPSTGHESDDAITLQGALVTEEFFRGGGIKDVLIAGVNSPQGAGIRMDTALYTTLDRVWVRGFDGSGGVGFHMTGASQNCSFNQCSAEVNDTGWKIDSAVNTGMNNCRADANVTNGVLLNQVAALTWVGGLLQGSTQYGLHIVPGADGVIGVKFINTYCEMGGDAIVRADTTGSVTNFVWDSSANMILTNGSGKFFDFDIPIIDFAINAPRTFHSVGQTLLRVGNSSTYGEVSFGHGPVAGSYFDINTAADVRLMWRSGKSIGFTSAGPPNASVTVDCGENKAFMPPRCTTAQRDAMTPAAGWTIYNTTTSKVQTYDGATWQDHW